MAARGIRKSVVVALVLLFGCTSVQPAQRDPARPQNVILMIADGTGPATATMARDYLRAVSEASNLALDEILVGSVQTHSTSSRITDSAAGATAYSTGVKTSNSSVGTDSDGRPLGTIVEAAEAKGMATGVVVQSFLADATPASFMAHVPERDMMNESAAQIVEQTVDVVMGGGRTHFVPSEAGGSREDGRDLLQEWREKGYQVVLSGTEFAESLRTPLVGIFAEEDMAPEIDRADEIEPPLVAMARRAVDLLQDHPTGFLLIVEGSNIDVAGHRNDAAAMLQDMLAYDEAVAAMVDFARQDGNTLMISVADHETGGLTLGRSGASWRPEVLAGVQRSNRAIADELTSGSDPIAAFRRLTGIDDLSDEEDAALREAVASNRGVSSAVGSVINRRAGVGWTSGGHTAVDVHLYAFGPGADRLAGHHDNTYVGRTIAELLDLDLGAATAAARATLSGR
jgi:alkaline phosphatase